MQKNSSKFWYFVIEMVLSAKWNNQIFCKKKEGKGIL